MAVFLALFASSAYAAVNGQKAPADSAAKAQGGDLKTLVELRSAAAKGDATAQRNLGEFYATGRMGRSYARSPSFHKDYVQAAAWLIIARLGSNGGQNGSSATFSKLQTKMTTAQIAEAWNQVGMFYATDQTGKNEQTQADHWLRKAAQAGNANAQYTLGLRYEQGRGRVQSDALAIRYFLDAAAQGRPEALDALQSMAGSGVGEAQAALGWLYAEGKGVARDYEKAYYWWRKAADQGDPLAQLNLGSLYEGGNGVGRNYTKAAHWYRKAVELRNTTAQVRLGMLYTSGHGVTQNYGIAATWFKKAAEDGDAEAMAKLGALYANGRGVKKSPAHAVALFEQAAKRGNADGQEALGSLLEHSQGVVQHEERAAVLYMLAKSGGNARAALSLAKLEATLSPKQLAWARQHARMWRTVYFFQRASHGDLAAFGKLRKMAKNGITGAQVALGTLYNAGVLMATNVGAASALYRKAAQKGNANAYYNLGELYAQGQGGSKDHTRALKWLMLAAANGNYRASAEAAALKWKMTSDEIAKAAHSADKWQATHPMQ